MPIERRYLGAFLGHLLGQIGLRDILWIAFSHSFADRLSHGLEI
jgi:hypothetical protein